MYKKSVYPPPAEYLYITQSSNILKIDSNGEHVVLARFPSEGKTLEAFGLTPSRIKTLALPNDLKEWPTTALNKCTNLEKISVYGPEVDEGTITIMEGHRLRLLTNLKRIQLPSTVIATGDCPSSTPCFPTSLQFADLSKNITQIGSEAFLYSHISYIDLSKCKKLTEVRRSAFNSSPLTSLDLSGCSSLISLVGGVFYGCTQLKTVIWRNKSRVFFYSIDNYAPFANTSVLFEVDLALPG